MIEDKEAIKKAIPGIALAEFEVSCIINIAKEITSSLENNAPIEKCDANLTQVFVAQPFSFIGIIALCEYVKAMEVLEVEEVNTFKKVVSYELLKKIRNNIHLFRKDDKNKQDINQQIFSQLFDFTMIEKDETYYLRNDISLMFEVEDNVRKFCGSNYYFLLSSSLQCKSFACTQY